jgi:hypothetical protein
VFGWHVIKNKLPLVLTKTPRDKTSPPMAILFSNKCQARLLVDPRPLTSSSSLAIICIDDRLMVVRRCPLPNLHATAPDSPCLSLALSQARSTLSACVCGSWHHRVRSNKRAYQPPSMCNPCSWRAASDSALYQHHRSFFMLWCSFLNMLALRLCLNFLWLYPI